MSSYEDCVKNTTPVDTDGIYDKCADCNARARPTKLESAITTYGVECSECGNAIAYHASPGRAMVVWNQMQRQSVAGQQELAKFAKMVEGMDASELRRLTKIIFDEERKRAEMKCKMEDKCPDCDGAGYNGSELDHEPCSRCKTTGKYRDTGINIVWSPTP